LQPFGPRGGARLISDALSSPEQLAARVLLNDAALHFTALDQNPKPDIEFEGG
jgi:hypothetical protein